MENSSFERMSKKGVMYKNDEVVLPNETPASDMDGIVMEDMIRGINILPNQQAEWEHDSK